ncbi:VOC family protein [Amnibacterium sp. CER49]|uniref:VOC family protein n=1 Tax=Amnibacterium sp. CER49 TaxID=3039161 RepID=UPI002448EB9B|nr:VOC family protein [Amnibacterium sp. CER49]MDH2443769.1 VOC family protein [Amnibacterium sp. CER49]
MSTVLNPYISFRGNAREAMEYYRDALGGDLELATFKDFHASEDPSDDDLVMHAKLTTRSGLVLMGADRPDRMPYTQGDSIAVSLGGEERAELQGYWDGLAERSTVLQPLEASPWGDRFGMLVDPYGVTWLVNIAASAA